MLCAVVLGLAAAAGTADYRGGGDRMDLDRREEFPGHGGLRKDAQQELDSEHQFHGQLDGMAKGLADMKDQMDGLLADKKAGKADPGALKGLIDSLSSMADMPHADMHIVGTGANKMYDLRFLSKMPDLKGKKDGKTDDVSEAKSAVDELAAIASGTTAAPPAAATAPVQMAPANRPVESAPAASRPVEAPASAAQPAPAAAPAPAAQPALPVPAAPAAPVQPASAAQPAAPPAELAPASGKGVIGEIRQLSAQLLQDQTVLARMQQELATPAPDSSAAQLHVLESQETANQQMLAKVLQDNQAGAKSTQSANDRADKAEASLRAEQQRADAAEAKLRDMTAKEQELEDTVSAAKKTAADAEAKEHALEAQAEKAAAAEQVAKAEEAAAKDATVAAQTAKSSEAKSLKAPPAKAAPAPATDVEAAPGPDASAWQQQEDDDQVDAGDDDTETLIQSALGDAPAK